MKEEKKQKTSKKFLIIFASTLIFLGLLIYLLFYFHLLPIKKHKEIILESFDFAGFHWDKVKTDSKIVYKINYTVNKRINNELKQIPIRFAFSNDPRLLFNETIQINISKIKLFNPVLVLFDLDLDRINCSTVKAAWQLGSFFGSLLVEVQSALYSDNESINWIGKNKVYHSCPNQLTFILMPSNESKIEQKGEKCFYLYIKSGENCSTQATKIAERFILLWLQNLKE